MKRSQSVNNVVYIKIHPSMYLSQPLIAQKYASLTFGFCVRSLLLGVLSCELLVFYNLETSSWFHSRSSVLTPLLPFTIYFGCADQVLDGSTRAGVLGQPGAVSILNNAPNVDRGSSGSGMRSFQSGGSRFESRPTSQRTQRCRIQIHCHSLFNFILIPLVLGHCSL